MIKKIWFEHAPRIETEEINDKGKKMKVIKRKEKSRKKENQEDSHANKN